MDKATHFGTCQVCGRRQKLPGNLLAKHAYTTAWGFFNGTCPGSEHKPFEVAFDRIQLSIDAVKAQITNLRKQIVDLNAEPVGNVAPFQAYRSKTTNRYERTGYYESTVTLSLDERGTVLLMHAKDDTRRKVEHGFTYSLHGTIEEIVLKLRASKAARIDGWIAERQKSVDWQQNRIDTWKPGTLIPIKSEAA